MRALAYASGAGSRAGGNWPRSAPAISQDHGQHGDGVFEKAFVFQALSLSTAIPAEALDGIRPVFIQKPSVRRAA